MGSREDDEYWNDKYAEASCYFHGEDEMWYDTHVGEWRCGECDYDDEIGDLIQHG